MKQITFLAAFLCLFLLFSCKKDVVTPENNTIQSTAFSKNIVADAVTGSDDTRTLQSQLDAGNVTLTAGKIYNITGLSVTHTLNLNGATINMTNTSEGSIAISLDAAGASVANGTLKGLWDNTTPGNPSSVIGMFIGAANCSVSHVAVSSFASFGILAGPYNNPSVTYCTIQNTGYISFFFDAESSSTTGGTFSNNIVDRSMISASSVSQLAVGIRGSTSNPGITTSQWTVSGNTIKMPYHPATSSAECMEVRYFNNSAISNNIVTGGSIGISVVGCSGVTVSRNSVTYSKLENLEFGTSAGCSSISNFISGSANVGELIDGSSNNITLMGDFITNTTQECIHAYTNTTNLNITACTLKASAGAKAINLQGTDKTIIRNTIMDGNSVATEAVMLDTCPGNVTITGGSISNFKNCVIAIYNCKAGLMTNNVTMSGVTVAGVPNALSNYIQNGALLGSNIIVVNH